MIAMKETTKWTGSLQPNHTYLFDGDKALAYIPKGSNVPHYFTTPVKILRNGRTFVEVKPNPFKIKVAESNVVKVKGSKGNVYEVDPDAGTCTCPGFMFRNWCKHLEQVTNNR